MVQNPPFADSTTEPSSQSGLPRIVVETKEETDRVGILHHQIVIVTIIFPDMLCVFLDLYMWRIL